jgi:hypothetical protein
MNSWLELCLSQIKMCPLYTVTRSTFLKVLIVESNSHRMAIEQSLVVSIDSADCIAPLLVVHLGYSTREQIPTAQRTRIGVQLLKKNSDEFCIPESPFEIILPLCRL